MKIRIRTPKGWDEILVPSVLEGHQFFWVLRPTFQDPQDPRNLGGASGLPGKYRVVFTLAKPGHALHPLGKHVPECELEGDSNLYIGYDFAKGHVLLLKVDDQDFEVKLVANSQGKLGKLVLEAVEANNFPDARRRGWAAVSPTLSLLAANLDIPLYISQTDINELRVGALYGAIIVDHADVGLYLPALISVSEEFRHYASMYREALNSNSPSYEFLCLFKIIESVSQRRQRLASEAKGRGESFTRPIEKFPTANEMAAWLDSLVPPTARRDWTNTNIASTFPLEALGRRFGYLIDQHLRPLRNSIAHGLLDTGELGTSIDNAELSRWRPGVGCSLVIRGVS